MLYLWPLRRKAPVILGLLLAACSGSTNPSDTAGGDGKVTLFVTTEIKGQIEPCGCTSDPMGDLARTAALVANARRAGATIVLDGGSLLYTDVPQRDARKTQEELKADLLAGAFRDHLHASAVGLGPFDLAAGPGGVRLPRQAANVRGVEVEAPKVITAGDVRVGVFGVVAPDLMKPHGVEATDPVAAAKRAVADLRAQNAQVVVALAHMERKQVKALVREVPGIDFAVIGAGAPEPDAVGNGPDRVGDTWLVQPANRGQTVIRLDITTRGGDGPLADAIGAARAKQEIAALVARIERLGADVTKAEADPNADKDFIATMKQDLIELSERRDSLKKSPLRVPDRGSYFVMAQIAISKTLACDEAIQKQKIAYDEAVGKANLAAASPPVPAAKGQASYAGTEECGFCHKEAVAFWNETKHATAWKTLVDVGKQYNLDCVYCHVVGFDAPGGSTLATLTNPGEDVPQLRDVQCEVCHGPSSIHVDEDGKEKPSSLRRLPKKEVCIACHNALHSDTFEYEAYLRDVTGPGHGEEFRKTLGEGPTGHKLRWAALIKTGATVGKGCPK